LSCPRLEDRQRASPLGGEGVLPSLLLRPRREFLARFFGLSLGKALPFFPVDHPLFRLATDIVSSYPLHPPPSFLAPEKGYKLLTPFLQIQLPLWYPLFFFSCTSRDVRRRFPLLSFSPLVLVTRQSPFPFFFSTRRSRIHLSVSGGFFPPFFCVEIRQPLSFFSDFRRSFSSILLREGVSPFP